MSLNDPQPPLTAKEIRQLRSLLHHRKPIVTLGTKGLTPAVIQETNCALTAHELIKIRTQLSLGKTELRKLGAELCKATGAELVQVIGKIIAIYRKNLQDDQICQTKERAPVKAKIAPKRAPKKLAKVTL